MYLNDPIILSDIYSSLLNQLLDNNINYYDINNYPKSYGTHIMDMLLFNDKIHLIRSAFRIYHPNILVDMADELVDQCKYYGVDSYFIQLNDYLLIAISDCNSLKRFWRVKILIRINNKYLRIYQQYVLSNISTIELKKIFNIDRIKTILRNCDYPHKQDINIKSLQLNKILRAIKKIILHIKIKLLIGGN